MIGVNGISISFSGIDLFKDISFLVNTKDRIGLVGKNGAGKSTLMKVIMGHQKLDSGSVTIPSDESLGYLAQELTFQSEKTVIQEALSAFEEAHKLHEEINEINHQLETRTDYESDSYHQLIHDLTEKHQRLDIIDHGNPESEAEKILIGLGFTRDKLQMRMNQFSMGWQMRVELAKLLLLRPSLLLLDEPTNHLDIEAIIWLEDYLKNYSGAIMMISHDKMFLDNVTNRTIEIVMGKTFDYKVPYTKYLVLRAERINQQLRAQKNQQDYIKQQEKFITRFKAKATKAKAAQSKQKMLDKVERIEIDIVDSSSIQFRFPEAKRAGQVVLKAENVAKSYGKNQIFTDVNLEINRGEKVALVGQNGMGKSTFLKLFCEDEKYEGTITLGHNVEMNYYAQVQENTLDSKITVYQTIENIATNEWTNPARMRGLLGTFLFKEDDMDKKVKVLSGGEKSRLALAKMLLVSRNLLVMDEPTNHLDIASKEMLKQALLGYNGTLVVVSHDRDFLDGLTDKTFEFINGKVQEHLGPISDFLRKHQSESFREFETTGNKSLKKEGSSKKKEKTPEKESYEQKKAIDKAIRKLQKDISNAEKKIERLEFEILKIEEEIAKNAADNPQELYQKHAETSRELENVMSNWEKSEIELEEMQRKS